jgi:hypothetical protein
MTILGIILILIAFFLYGGLHRQQSGEIDVVFYYNSRKVKFICFLLIALAIMFFIM